MRAKLTPVVQSLFDTLQADPALVQAEFQVRCVGSDLSNAFFIFLKDDESKEAKTGAEVDPGVIVKISARKRRFAII